MKERGRSAPSRSLREKYPKGFVLPESEIQKLVLNLRISEAHEAGMCLLVIGEAIKAIVEDKTESRVTNVHLIKQLEREEGCRPIQSLIEAIVAAMARR